jgi:hypothetical protein
MIRLNEAAIAVLLNSPDGPVGRDILRRSIRVEEKARENASGPVIGIRSGDLLQGLHSGLGADERGLVGVVSTDARHRGFAYPTFHDTHGRPWLTAALQDVFNG